MASLIVNQNGSKLLWLVAGLIGLSVEATPSSAEINPLTRPHEIGSKASGTDQSGSARSARSPLRKADRSGSFIYEIIDTIRARSGDLCMRYGSPADCLEEAEVCLTMRDMENNQVRMCLNTVPGEEEPKGRKLQRTRARP
jgi:hypothetical protein